MAEFKLVEVKDAGGAPFQSIIEIDGRRVPLFTKPPEKMAGIVHDIVNMELRDDDIMFCSATKSGTHWGFEIISMLLSGNAETTPVQKVQTWLETTHQTELEKVPSPRVLNSHLPLSALPRQLKEKKTKIVLILRNPKDISVSYYHHHKGIAFYDYNGKFEDFLPVLVKGELDYGSWFDYVEEFERDMESGDYNIHLVFFEDLKENCVEEIKKISKFLGIPENEDLCAAICDKCRFDKMAVDKAYPKIFADKMFKGNFTMFRKGEIGDWKNYYTVTMNEWFDKLYGEKMNNSKLKFRFTPSV